MDFSAYFPFKPAFHPYLDEQESHVKVPSRIHGRVARCARYPAPKPGQGVPR